jgi:SAM-dependent methyltransferase
VVHIGIGTGYYTAILAHLTRPSGRVTGIEYDGELAARANLAKHPNVEILQGDGALVAFDQADVTYVNAGCTRPAESWLDRLAEGGRLILPMTSDQGFGTPDGASPTANERSRGGEVPSEPTLPELPKDRACERPSGPPWPAGLPAAQTILDPDQGPDSRSTLIVETL